MECTARALNLIQFISIQRKQKTRKQKSEFAKCISLWLFRRAHHLNASKFKWIFSVKRKTFVAKV